MQAPAQSAIRRPAVAKLAMQLQRKNPNWPWEKCVAEAKARLT